MAVFSNNNLQGANEKLNKSLTDAKALKDSLLANHGGDASTILASLESKVSDLQNSFVDMIPELPTIPNINMQSEFATLTNFDIGTPQYQSQVANITSQFGPAMKAKGLDIESLARQILAGGSIGDLLPNLQLPDGELVPVELPAEVTLPSKESVKEETPKVDKETDASLKTKDIEKNKEEVSGATKTGTVVPETKEKLYGFKLYLSLRTYVPGTYKNFFNQDKAIQRLSDKDVDRIFKNANRNDGSRYQLPAYALTRQFDSVTFDEGMKNGLGRKQALINAREKGDWNWKEDSAGFIYYVNRYKKNRKT